jgi:hypothetical protein
MEGCHHRHLKVLQQLHDVVSGIASEDSVFMLQAHQICVVCIQIVGGRSVGREIAFADLKMDSLGVRVG